MPFLGLIVALAILSGIIYLIDKLICCKHDCSYYYECCKYTSTHDEQGEIRSFIPKCIKKRIKEYIPHMSFISDDTECPICMEELPVSPAILPCGHKFHHYCVGHCFRAGSDFCPLCKSQVPYSVMHLTLHITKLPPTFTTPLLNDASIIVPPQQQ